MSGLINNYPLTSIVIPSFKAVNTIQRTLDSLYAQDYPALEIIVIDGGSHDGTAELLAAQGDKLSSWISERDKCQADALNKGFARATGEIFGWLCADDTLLPGAIHHMVHFLKNHPDIDVVTGGCKRDFNGKSEVITEPPEDFYTRMDYMNPIEQPSTLWRVEAHRRAGELDLTYKYAFDWEWWCRLKRTGSKFGRMTEPFSVYHFSDDNLTSSGGTKIADEMYRIIKEYGPYNGRLADIYRFLYRTFDLRGFYDSDASEKLPSWQIKAFHSILRVLYQLYGETHINAYNWNFCSRQERGLGWA